MQSEPIAYTRLLSTNNPQESLASQIDTLYLEMLSVRESCKLEDLEKITSVSIPKAHLQMVYDHLEQPEIKEANNEVL